MLTSAGQFTINTVATATATQMASFAIGSRLVSLNGGLLNAPLGGMIGTTLSLLAMDYQSLIDAKVDAFYFMSALATKVNLTGVTYDSLLSSNVKVADIISAMVTAQTAANGLNAATTALQNVSLAMVGITKTITPSSLISAGPYGSMIAGQKPKTGVSVSAFDMLNATGSLANGTNEIAANVNLSLPGIASVTLMATVGERPVATSWVTVGSAGATVHPAQTRILLQVQLVGSGAVSVLSLSVYVEIAAGTATLNSASCGYPSVNTSTVQLGLPIPGIGPLMTSIISGATSSIDTLLASVLQSLGVGLGQADVWVTGVRCDGAVLAN